MEFVKSKFWKPDRIAATITKNKGPYWKWPAKKQYCVGYHIEGGEPFEMSGRVPLSMETLCDNRPLFLCANPTEWNPLHLKHLDAFNFYRVVFEMPLCVVYRHQKDYLDTFEYDSRRSLMEGCYILSSGAGEAVKLGVGMFRYDSDDMHELSEGYLVHPVRDVKEIHRFACSGEALTDYDNLLLRHIGRNILPLSFEKDTSHAT